MPLSVRIVLGMPLRWAVALLWLGAEPIACALSVIVANGRWFVHSTQFVLERSEPAASSTSELATSIGTDHS